MEYTYELNNKRTVSKEVQAKYPQTSIASEIFSALVNGKSVDRFKAANVDKAVKDFKELGSRAVHGDGTAISEINALLTNVIQAPTMEELKLLSIFGTYKNVGYGDDIKREVYHQAGEAARERLLAVMFRSLKVGKRTTSFLHSLYLAVMLLITEISSLVTSITKVNFSRT